MANLTYSHPRAYGKDSRHCRVCKTTRGLIRKYNLNMCRRCFRERATDIGFVKDPLAYTNSPLHHL
uniref:40S ribosomal protein S29 n=1 Tax=Hyaloperonospora arabidopsidis (strain Emoy2) TaxID=559515 RepID=M4BA03_HYAAE